MKIKITADSTCDLGAQLIEKHDIGILPLYVNMGDKTLKDGVNIQPNDIFAHVGAGGAITTTAAVTPLDYEVCFKKNLESYDAIIHINIGSGFSSCHQNARIAAEGLENVFVVDSKNLSTGQGHVVLEAALMAEAGESPAAIVGALQEDIIPKVEASFIIDRLDYMAKGGRCSTVAALGANVLQLKPSIEVVDGAMRVGPKYRGSFEKCIAKYVKDRLEGRDDIRTERIFITHPACTAQDVEIARSAIAQYGAFDTVAETNTGCTVASHCGPRTIGVLFIKK